MEFEPICREHGGAHVLYGLCLVCENARLRTVFDLLKSNTKELQSDCIHMSNELSEKKLQIEELKKEVSRQHGEPFTCGHEPKYAGGACAACHSTWIERATVAERLNSEFLKHRDGLVCDCTVCFYARRCDRAGEARRAIIKATVKRKSTGCDCGATLAFPAHQPGCPLNGPYDLPV